MRNKLLFLLVMILTAVAPVAAADNLMELIEGYKGKVVEITYSEVAKVETGKLTYFYWSDRFGLHVWVVKIENEKEEIIIPFASIRSIKIKK